MTGTRFSVSAAKAQPLSIWAVSDGRAGIESQVLGLAEAIARLTAADVETRRLRYAPMFDWLPTPLKLLPDAMLDTASDRIVPPYPNIWIAAGRATLPHSLRMKALSGGRTMVVQLQDPKTPLDAFDLVIAPEHDRLQGANVLSLLGSSNRITRERLEAEARDWEAQISSLPRPRVAALIGGRSKAHDLSATRARAMATSIRAAVERVKGSLLLTVSRRTPEDARVALMEGLQDLNGLFHTGEGANPYFAFLGAADHILVTEDSVNMATEAAVTGKPVHILGMDERRSTPKFDAFHAALEAQGISRAFSGELDSWTYAPLDETARAAQAVLKRFDEMFPGHRIGG